MSVVFTCMDKIEQIPVGNIIYGVNDRTEFKFEDLQDLATSIEEHGLAQPITVRLVSHCHNCGYRSSEDKSTCPICNQRIGRDVFEIVAGERRFRAIRDILHRDTVPAIVRDLEDKEASAIMLIENLQRKDIDPVDEAFGYEKRVEQGWEMSDFNKIGIKTERVRRRLKLTKVRSDLLDLVRKGKFPLTHAETLSELDHAYQMVAARPILNGKWVSVQDLRATVAELLVQQQAVELFSVHATCPETKVEPLIDVVDARFPFADNLPPMRGGAKYTGQALVDYSVDLWNAGHIREAMVVGWVLKQLTAHNYTYIPKVVVNSQQESNPFESGRQDLNLQDTTWEAVALPLGDARKQVEYSTL